MKKSTENFTEHQKPAIESTLEDLVNTDGLEYAHYVLQNRALVEVFGDGLKPVQRRILYGMYKMGSTPSSKTIKGARIAGEVIGKYHPHGNCIHGDERFILQTGEIKTIRELYELTQEDPNITFEGYSIKRDGQLVPSIISNVRIGQYTNEEYNIYLSNGDVIRVTDEHPIRLFNGDFIKTRELKTGDLLSTYKCSINTDDTMDVYIYNTINNGRYNLFELAKEWFRNELDYCQGNHIHHIDRNRCNNSILNLESLTPSEHAKEHLKDRRVIESLEKGTISMNTPEGKYYEATKRKNKEIVRILTDNQVYYKARKIIQYLINNNIEVNNDNYNTYREKGVIYNAPFISTLVNKGLIMSDVSELDLNMKIDFSKSVGFTRIDKSYNKRTLNRDTIQNNVDARQEYRFAKVVYNSKIRNISELSKFVYDKCRFSSQPVIACKYTNERKDTFLKNVAHVTKIEIKKVNNQPMYDFTVNGYENALFKTSDDTLVCLHNSSVEAAQEIMGQHFNTRIPMFKIQGTLGEFAGSAAPAARYYELGLNKNSWELVKELSQHATTYRVTEMGDDTEPLFLPARFPYSICNGSAGIAVGYASNMPPHNPDEVIDTCIAFYKNKIKKSDDVLKYMQGPDFPTGGEILGIDGIKEYFNTGSGSFTIRGKYKIEDLTRGRKLIDFYELPYQVSVAKVIESVYKLQERNQLKEISEVKDLSDSKRGLSCAIYVKSGSNVNKVIDDLFKSTPLQSKFSANMTALYKGVPKPNISMYEMIEGFCVFRQDCFIKRTSHRLEQIEAELLKYNGLLKVLVDIDKAIAIIRNAKNAEEANSKLQKTFKINEEQASYILAMKLRQLTKADKNEILAKADEVKKEDEKLKKILSDEKLIHKEIIKELEETKSIISNPRRTSILGVTNEELKEMAKKSAKQERLLEKDVDCYIHTIGDKIYKDLEQGKDYLFKTSSKSDVYLITEDADVVKVKMDSIPLNKENAISINSLNTVSSKAISIVDSSDDSLGVFISSKLGDVNIIKPPLKDGNKLAQLVPGDTINCVYSIKDEEDLSKSSIAFISVDGKIMKIKLDKIRMTRQGAGLVKGHSMEAECVSAFVVNNDNLIVTETKSEIKYTLPEDCPDKGRGGKGYQIHRMKKGESVLDAYKEDEYTTQKITPRGGGGVKKK